MIYFAQEQAGCRIKIGFTEGDAGKRIAELQTGCASAIVLLGTMPGDRATERELHERFAHARERAEWFRPVAELLLFIRSPDDVPPELRLRTPEEAAYFRSLIDQVERHGPQAFSRHGDGAMRADSIEDAARRLQKVRGNEALERVFDATEEVVYGRFPELIAAGVMRALDIRFDGIGDWLS